MRKLALATAVLLAASLTACGGASKTDNSSSGTGAKTTSTVSTTSSTSSTTSTTTSSDDSGSGGSDPGSSYCTELRTAKAKFKSLDFTGLDDDQFKNLTDEFDTLTSDAPDEVKADWATLTSALKKVQQILANAGLSFSDLQGLSSGQIPHGVTPQQLKKLGKDLQAFSADSSFQKAASHITVHAKAECGINMGN
jgi:hypothetical protein